MTRIGRGVDLSAGVRRCAAVALVAGLMLPTLLPAEESQRARPTPLPDLRIVQLSVSPNPAPEGSDLIVELLLHNDSTVSATGRFVTRVAHDRSPPFPLPDSAERFYLAADALETLTFSVSRPKLGRSPYQLMAMVDVEGAIAESNERNNVAWSEVEICGHADAEEIRDGFDNDCDGEIDEGFAVETFTQEEAQRILERMDRRVANGLPLAFALSRPVFPYATEYAVRLVAGESGPRQAALPAQGKPQLRAVGGGGEAVRVGTGPERGARFVLIDHDGAELEFGDLVSLETGSGEHYVTAVAGGGGAVRATATSVGRSELLTIVEAEDNTVTSSGFAIASGSRIVLLAGTGQFFTVAARAIEAAADFLGAALVLTLEYEQ